MLRFVVSPDRALVPDLAARLPGRGIWLSARRDVLEPARLRGAVARAARGPVTIPPSLGTDIAALLARRLVELLGLARRAGQAVCGFEKARAWVRSGEAGLLVAATDGSPEERSRLLSGRSVPVVSPLDGATLGGVFGRDRAVHVALRPGRLADMVVDEAARLSGVAGTGGAPGALDGMDGVRPGDPGRGGTPEAAGRATGREA